MKNTALALLGMMIASPAAHAALVAIPVTIPAPVAPIAKVEPAALPTSVIPLSLPMSLPAQPIAIPSIGGPLTRLPSPAVNVPTLPGAVVKLSTFAAAKKAFAGKDGEQTAPSEEKLNAAFDNAKAEKAEAGDDAPVRAESRRRNRRDPVVTLPEYDLLTEIGIPR